MIRKQIAVLLIEENARKAVSLHVALTEAQDVGVSFESIESTAAAAQRIAQGTVDAILFSLSIADDQRLEAVRKLRARTPQAIPIIVVSDAISDQQDQEFTIKAIRAGAQDCISSSRITGQNLVHSITSAVERSKADTLSQHVPSDAMVDSSQMLKLVLEHMPAFVFWKDRNSVYLGCNSLFAANAGLSSPEEIIGLTDLDLPWKDSEAESYRADDQRVMASGTPKLNYEETQLTADGRLTFVRTSKIPLQGPEGQVVGILGTFEDITERKLAEARLAEAEAKYRSLVEESLVGVYLIQNNKFVYVNDCMARIFGYDRTELIGTRLEDLVVAEDLQLVLQNVRKREADEVHSIQYSFRGIRKDGRIIDVEVLGARTTYNGHPAVLGSLLDITERKRSEEALRRLNRELRAISSCNQMLLRATDEKTLVDAVCRIVCEDAGYRMAWVGYREDNEAKSVRPIAWAGVEDGYLVMAAVTWADNERGRGPTGTAIRTGETAFANFETDANAKPWRENALQRGYRCSVALPLKDEAGNSFGNLTVFATEHDAFGPEDIRLLEGLAADLAFGIVTLRGRAERRKAERIVALLSFALDNVREAAILTDENARIRYVNKEACRILCYTRDELLRMSVPDIDPHFPMEIWPEHWSHLKALQSLNFEGHHRTKDGRHIPVEISANYFEYEGNGYNLGLVRDISGRKQVEEERAANLHFFESMARVNQAMQGTNDLEIAMGDVLGEVLSIFDCDRTFLVYPCDPEAPSMKVVMERTRPDCPGAVELGLHLPGTPESRQTCRSMLASTEPLTFGPGLELPLPPGLDAYGVQSRVCTALYPKGDKPYIFGLHQCSRMRVWTASERRLLQEIGRKISDSLTSMLAFRNLRDSERRMEEAQRIAHVGAWDCDLINNVVVLSDEALRILGLSIADSHWELAAWRDQWLQMVHPDDRERVTQALADALENSASYDIEYRVLRPTAEERVVHVIAEVIRDASGRPVRILGTTQDITERKRAQQEQAELRQHLQQAQKMEAVGHLAGGIAHDFNNILGVIIGYSELVFRDPNTPEETRSRVEEIISAGQRAAALTRRLLAFSRKLVLQPQVLDLNEIIEGFDKILRRLLGDEIEIRTKLDPKLDLIEADPSQIEQVLLNLCINARDAMPEGGRLTIETSNVESSTELQNAEHFSIPSGRCVKVTVRDNGIGMSAETVSHLFEPFFTTKPQGKGTGLGLATVYGIVKQSGGHIVAESKLGWGSTFTVYLPRTSKQLEFGNREEAKHETLRGSETVLLVEDAAPLRSLLSNVMEDFGYKVLEAEDGEHATEVAEQFRGEI